MIEEGDVIDSAEQITSLVDTNTLVSIFAIICGLAFSLGICEGVLACVCCGRIKNVSKIVIIDTILFPFLGLSVFTFAVALGFTYPKETRHVVDNIVVSIAYMVVWILDIIGIRL